MNRNDRIALKRALTEPLSDLPDTLDAHEQALLVLADGDETSNWRKGWHWSKIVDEKLYLQAGYKSPEAYFQKRLKVLKSRRALELYAAVARIFSEKAAHYGIARLDLLRQYREAHGTTGDADDPGSELIAIPGKHAQTKPFAQCTAAELRRAIRGPAQPGPKPGKVPASPVLDLVQEMRMDWLGGERTDVKAAVKNGKVWVSLGWFELEKIGPFCDAVSGVLADWKKAGIPKLR